MASKRKKIAIVVFLLLLIGAVGSYLFLKKKKEISLGMAEKIPSTYWIGKISVMDLLNQSTPQIQSDSSTKKWDLNKWDYVLQNPFKLGLDVLADPWIYGSDTSFCLLMHMSDSNQFIRWLKNDVEEIKKLKWQAKPLYNSAFVIHENILFTWDEKGTCLIIKNGVGDPHQQAVNYYANKSGRDLSFVKNIKGGVVKIQTFPENYKGNSIELTSFLAGNSYAISISKNSIKINDRIEETENKSPLIINLNEGFITQKQFWTHPEISTFFTERLPLQNIDNETFEEVYLEFEKIDTLFHEVVTYEYDDDFNKVEVKKRSPYYSPKWVILTKHNSPRMFENFPPHKMYGKGKMAFSCLKFGDRIDLMSEGAKSDLYLQKVDTSYSYIHLNWAEILKQKEQIPFALPFQEYNFIKGIEYQSKNNRFYFEVFFN